MSAYSAEIQRLLAAAATDDAAGQAALARLYHYYDPLIRAALPKGLTPEDAEDVVMETWAAIVSALRPERHLRTHRDVVTLIARQMRAAVAPDSGPAQRRSGLPAALKRFVRLLLPGQGE